MTKFCIHCGKPLEEGEVCSCQQQTVENEVPISESINNNQQQIQNQVQQNNQQQIQNQVQQNNQQQIQSQVQQKVTTYFSKIFFIFKNVLKQPTHYMKEYTATGEYQSALGLIGIQAIISAFFAIVCVGKINSYIESFYTGFGDYLDDVNIVKFSLGKVFIITTITSFALSCALAGILYLIVKLFKGNTTYNHMLCAASARSIAIIPISILAIIVFYIDQGCGLGLFFAGNLLGICFLINAMITSLSIDENKTPYIVFISVLIFMIVSFYIMKTTSKMLIPEQYKSAWSELFNLFKNPTQFLGDL